MVADGRVYSGGRQIDKGGELAPPAAARRVLLDPEVDVAVLEIAPDDVRRHGLGCDALNVAVIVNRGTGDLDREEMEVIRLVARSTRDVVFVGDSSGIAAGVEGACDGAAICRVVFEGPGSRRARGRAPAGARRAVLKGGSLFIHEPGRRRQEIPLAGLPGHLPGLDRRATAECAAYASAAAFGLGEKPGDILRGLIAIRSSLGSRSVKR
jgi:hypothetical protein